MDIALEDIEAARARIAAYVRHTPLAPGPSLRTDIPQGLLLKLENLQISGSFKARGAFNNLLQMSPEQRQQGVVVASGGNHGLAIAIAAARIGTPATVFLPSTASPDRVARIVAWGAEVVRFGANSPALFSESQRYATERGMLYVHPYDAERTVHGTGTLGLELLDDVPDLDCVLIAIGGGGLIGGMAAAIKQRHPTVRIIGVEPTGAPSMLASLDAGHVVELPSNDTIADTLSPRAVSELTLDLTRRYVDEVVLVSDAQMVRAMRSLWAECNQLVEPAGAAVIAALQSGVADVSRHTRPVALICGGNANAESVFASYGY